MKRSLLPLAAFAVSLLFVSCKSGEPINLKLNLQPGSQYLYTVDNKTTTETSAMGQSIKMDNNMTMEFTYDVAAGGGNDRRITVSYDRIAMDMKTPMMNMSYDSKDPSKGDRSLAVMGNMLHKTFTMEVSDQGEIKKIEGMQAIISSMGDTNTAEGASMQAQMAQNFNDTTLKSIMQQSLNIFPDHPVRPGDKWKKSYNLSISMMNMTTDNEFKLVSVSGNTAHLETKGKITGAGSANNPEMKNMSFDVTGDQKGTMDVEIATGLVTDGKIKQNLKMQVSQMGMKVPINISQDMHFSAKKK